MRGVLRWTWRSFTLFRLARVPVQAHSTWFVLPVGLHLTGAWLDGGWRGLPIGLCVIAGTTASLLVHDFAHVLVARRYGIQTRRVLLMPLGAIADAEQNLAGKVELLVALAGPAASLLLAGLGWLVSLSLGPLILCRFNLFHHGCFLFALFNALLGLFNLLPCYPMDGGRVARALLTLAAMRYRRRSPDAALLFATRVAVRWIAWPIAGGMIAVTLLVTHVWPHVLLFALVVVLGEAELCLLKHERNAQRNGVNNRAMPSRSRTGIGRASTSPSRISRALRRRSSKTATNRAASDAS
jgi:stage IV sporulation protein FB